VPINLLHSLIGLINDKIRCNICKSEFANSKDTVDKHIKGTRHQKAIQEVFFNTLKRKQKKRVLRKE